MDPSGLFRLLAVLTGPAVLPAYGQVTCLLCSDQNDRVITGGADLLANGTFEDPGGIPYAIICPNSTAYAADVPGWTCTGGSTATYASLTDDIITLVPEGDLALYLGNSYCTVCPGTPSASCLVPGCVADGLSTGYPVSGPDFGGTAGVSVEQTVPGLLPGASYVLEFWAGGEDPAVDEGLFAVDVGFGMNYLRCPPTPPQPGTIGRRFVVVFTATGAAHTVRFTNWGHITAQSTEVVLDDIRLFAENDLPLPVACHTTVPVATVRPSVLLWPSPFTDVLHVERPDDGPTTFILRDAGGHLVIEAPLNRSLTLPLERLAPGSYTYTVGVSKGSCERGVVMKR